MGQEVGDPNVLPKKPVKRTYKPQAMEGAVEQNKKKVVDPETGEAFWRHFGKGMVSGELGEQTPKTQARPEKKTLHHTHFGRGSRHN